MSAVLKKLPIFKNLTDKDLERIAELVRVVEHPTGHVLFRQGDASDAFYIIETGAVQIVRHDDGTARQLGVLGEGDFFGEMGVIEDTARTADAVLSQDTKLLAIDKTEFHRFMAINPSISMKIMSLMARRYRAKPTEGEAAPAPGTAGVVMGVFSATGGVGNSFLASNLAVALKTVTKKRVLLVDLDLMFGDQAGIFNVQDPKSLADLHGEAEIDAEMVENVIQGTTSGVDLLQSPPRPEESELVTPDLVKVVIELMTPKYDFIILDTANAIQDLAITLLEQVDRAFYVLSPEFLSIKNAHRWLKIVELINISTSGIDLVLNKSTPADESFHAEIEKQLKKKFFARLPHDFDTARRALNGAKFLAVDFADRELSKNVVKMASSLAGVSAPPQEQKKSLWGRLMGT